MGVTYKLKQEVVDYILELKRVDQALSCRKISELASAHFQKTISKSSVNAVIKESLLSSPVGRRANPEARVEKFKIPEHRKEQIFINVPMSLLGETTLSPSAILSEGSASINNAGVMFLKAAEWQIKRQGVLRFLCEKFGPVLREEKILKLAESFLFLPLFGEQSSEKFIDFNKKILWQLNDLDFDPTIYQKKECYDILVGLESKALQINLELGQAFSEVSFFRFVLEDASIFCIDTQKNSLWEENNVHCDFSSCLDKSFDVLSKDFVMNAMPVFLRQATVKESLSASFFNMISSFANIPGKRIKIIDAVTSQGDVIASFEKIVAKKRHYVTGLYGCRGLLEQFVSDKKKEPQRIDDKLTHQAYYCWEATTAFRLPAGQQVAADIALVSQKKDAAPLFAVLTNIPSQLMPMEKVVSMYLEQWPQAFRGQALFSERHRQALNACCDIASFSDEKYAGINQEGLLQEKHFLAHLANTILFSLHDYCVRHFFDPQDRGMSFGDAQKQFYRLSGDIKKEPHLLRVKYILPKGYAYQNQLNTLVQHVNEAMVCDPKGRRLFMEIQTS